MMDVWALVGGLAGVLGWGLVDGDWVEGSGQLVAVGRLVSWVASGWVVLGWAGLGVWLAGRGLQPSGAISSFLQPKKCKWASL